MTSERKGMLAAAIAYGIFGLSYLFSKMALEITEPAILLGARFTITFALLNLLAFTRVLKLNLKGKPLAGPLLLGLLQPVLYFLLENYGIKYTTTSFAGILSSISPVFTAVLGALLLRERPNARQWLCIALSILGVMMVSLGSTGGENTLAGCLCLLGAYFSGAFYSILVRRLSRRFSAFELTYIMFAMGFFFFAGLAFFQYRGHTLPMLFNALTHRQFAVAVVYLGAFASVGAYMLSNYSLARLPVTRASIFTTFSTVVTVFSGVIVMNDAFTCSSALSFLLILTGVCGVNRFATPESARVQ
jgi:drug/metabolite transporter (DMT)-like permease